MSWPWPTRTVEDLGDDCAVVASFHDLHGAVTTDLAPFAAALSVATPCRVRRSFSFGSSSPTHASRTIDEFYDCADVDRSFCLKSVQATHTPSHSLDQRGSAGCTGGTRSIVSEPALVSSDPFKPRNTLKRTPPRTTLRGKGDAKTQPQLCIGIDTLVFCEARNAVEVATQTDVTDIQQPANDGDTTCFAAAVPSSKFSKLPRRLVETVLPAVPVVLARVVGLLILLAAPISEELRKIDPSSWMPVVSSLSERLSAEFINFLPEGHPFLVIHHASSAIPSFKSSDSHYVDGNVPLSAEGCHLFGRGFPVHAVCELGTCPAAPEATATSRDIVDELTAASHELLKTMQDIEPTAPYAGALVEPARWALAAIVTSIACVLRG